MAPASVSFAKAASMASVTGCGVARTVEAVEAHPREADPGAPEAVRVHELRVVGGNGRARLPVPCHPSGTPRSPHRAVEAAALNDAERRRRVRDRARVTPTVSCVCEMARRPRGS